MKKEINIEYEKRAQELIARMTLEEKIGMVHGAQLFATKGVPRLGIPPLVMSDGPCGVRQDFLPSTWQTVGTTGDYVSYLPCNSAIAATFHREVARGAGDILGAETRGRGKDMILGPGVNIKRSPLCGRNFEYFSEDPYLTKEMAVPLIQGVQNHDVAACIKHFAANNQETERLAVDTIVEDEALEEIYYPAYQAAIEEADVYAVMGAYNRLNGEHCCQSKQLLTEVLRKDWAYDGVVVSDWSGVHDTKEASESGLDIEMSVTDNFDEYYMAKPLQEAIENGEIPESFLDEKVKHILVLMQRLHMLGDTPRKRGAYNLQEHHRKLLEIAEESIVLLKNEEQILPLRPKKGARILMVGENAERLHAPGGGSAEIKALYEITPLLGLQMELGGDVNIEYVPGYTSGTAGAQDASWQETSLENRKSPEEVAKLEALRTQLRKEALERAKEADYVLFVGGLNHEEDCEGHDRTDMSLPYGQPELIDALLDIQPNMPVILIGGNPVEFGSWLDRCKALLFMFYNGMEGGRALAEVLIGRVNPSGRLPVSFYRNLSDCSAHAIGEFAEPEVVHYTEGTFVGYRYLDAKGIKPMFPFGYGLSYTTFVLYQPTKVVLHKNRSVIVLDVENTGAQTGAEVVQVFQVHPKYGYKQLCGFEKVFLQPGERATVEITVEAESDAVLMIGEDYEHIAYQV